MKKEIRENTHPKEMGNDLADWLLWHRRNYLQDSRRELAFTGQVNNDPISLGFELINVTYS